MAKPIDDPPYEGGSQPVPERRPEAPTAARGGMQTVVVVVGVLVVLAALAWFLVPIFAGSR